MCFMVGEVGERLNFYVFCLNDCCLKIWGVFRNGFLDLVEIELESCDWCVCERLKVMISKFVSLMFCLNDWCRKFWGFFLDLVEILLESFDFDVRFMVGETLNLYIWSIWFDEMMSSISKFVSLMLCLNDWFLKIWGKKKKLGLLIWSIIELESFGFWCVFSWLVKDSNLYLSTASSLFRSPWKCGTMCVVWKQCREAWVFSRNVFESLSDVFRIVLCRQLFVWLELPCSMVLLFQPLRHPPKV